MNETTRLSISTKSDKMTLTNATDETGYNHTGRASYIILRADMTVQAQAICYHSRVLLVHLASRPNTKYPGYMQCKGHFVLGSNPVVAI